jgi:prevent-host-death family protein
VVSGATAPLRSLRWLRFFLAAREDKTCKEHEAEYKRNRQSFINSHSIILSDISGNVLTKKDQIVIKSAYPSIHQENRSFISAEFDLLDKNGLPLYNLDRLDRRCNMAHVWQLQEAKNKFSEVVEAALKKGPQIISRRGVETVVVLSLGEYRKTLLSRKKLSEFFKESSLAEVDLDLTRDKSDIRSDVEL